MKPEVRLPQITGKNPPQTKRNGARKDDFPQNYGPAYLRTPPKDARRGGRRGGVAADRRPRYLLPFELRRPQRWKFSEEDGKRNIPAPGRRVESGEGAQERLGGMGRQEETPQKSRVTQPEMGAQICAQNGWERIFGSHSQLCASVSPLEQQSEGPGDRQAGLWGSKGGQVGRNLISLPGSPFRGGKRRVQRRRGSAGRALGATGGVCASPSGCPSSGSAQGVRRG